MNAHPAGLFSHTGIRYEVALDVLGSLIAHYAELIGIERSRPVPDASTVRQAEAIQRHLRRTRNGLDPRNAAEIGTAIAHYAPGRLYADPQNSSPQVPLEEGWGALWGDWRGKHQLVPARLEFKCAAAAKLCGSQAVTGKQSSWHGL